MNGQFKFLNTRGCPVIVLQPLTAEARKAVEEWAAKVRAEERETYPNAMGPFVDRNTGILSMKETLAARFFQEVLVTRTRKGDHV